MKSSKFSEQKKYIFNPDYILKHDKKRTVILSKQKQQLNNSSRKFYSFIHPIQATLLSFFSKPSTLGEITQDISIFFDIEQTKAFDLVEPFIENNESYYTEHGNNKFFFPKNTLIEYNESLKIDYTYKAEDFSYEQTDFETNRLFTGPKNLTFMLNNTCVTDCVYCYADRVTKITNQVPFLKVKKFIKEAKKNKIVGFNLDGGEVFLYKNWYKLLKELEYYDYKPDLISTKMPLKEAEIIKLTEFRNLRVQISLDSIVINESLKILNVKTNYIEKLKQTILLFDKYKIDYQIATILTTLNANENSLQQLFLFISKLKNIKHWNIRMAFRSLYSKSDFNKLKISNTEGQKLFDFVQRLNSKKEIKITFAKTNEKKFHSAKKGSRSFLGPKCSALTTHMFILPDGKVTICEQMYWNEDFIIGDIMTQSISEIWNSQRALELAYPKKQDLRDEIVCKTCDMFKKCIHEFHNKCWADTMKAYGKGNWDFADPRCVKAKKIKYEML